MDIATYWFAISNVSLMMVLATVIVIVAAFITVSFITRLMAGSIRGLEQRLSLSEGIAAGLHAGDEGYRLAVCRHC